MLRTLGSPLAAVALLPALTACTGDRQDGDATGEETTDPSAAECTTEPETADGLTAPGQVLCLGTAATVPVIEDGATGVVEVSVTAVRELPEEERVTLDQSAFYGSTYPSSDHDVHLVRYRVTVVSEDREGAFTGADTVFDASWSSLQPWAEEVESPVGVGPAGCRSADHARGQAPDDEVTGCEWAFVGKGGADGARFWNATAGYHPEHGGDFVYWK